MKKANIFVMTVAGLFLLVGSVLKCHQILTTPIISEGFWESWAFFVIQVPLELGLAIWLLSGLFRKAAWLLTTASFALFVVVTFQKTIAGAESCGCFGAVHVDPRITLLAIDIPIFLALVIFRPLGQKFLSPLPSAKHFFSILFITAIIMAALVPTLLFNKVEPVDTKEWINPIEPNNVIQDSNAVPVPVVRKEWPMLKDIDIAEQLRTGIWIVVCYHHDCPTCAELIPVYEKAYREIKDNDVIKVALVEMPPFGGPDEQLVPADTVCTTGQLAENWHVMSPLVVVLSDSEVLEVSEGKPVDFDKLLEKALGG